MITTARTPRPPEIHEVVLEAGPVSLSGLLAEPAETQPRCVVVAVHGAGMRAGYFHSQAHPDLSLLTLGANLGFSVLALDRPGYGRSALQVPDGQCLAEQTDALHRALADFAVRHDTGAGFFLLGHSYGGKLVLRAAADGATDLIGLDVSGLSHRYAVDLAQLEDFHGRSAWGLHWGQLSCYPPGAFRLAGELVCPMPSRERRDAMAWPDLFPGIAGLVKVPVRFTYAEHERWWRHDEESLATMIASLCAAPRVVVDRLPRAGHNISLGWAARAYHLRALAFLEECLAERARSGPGVGASRWSA